MGDASTETLMLDSEELIDADEREHIVAEIDPIVQTMEKEAPTAPPSLSPSQTLPRRSLPVFQVSLVCFILLSDAFSITVLLPFVRSLFPRLSFVAPKHTQEEGSRRTIEKDDREQQTDTMLDLARDLPRTTNRSRSLMSQTSRRRSAFTAVTSPPSSTSRNSLATFTGAG